MEDANKINISISGWPGCGSTSMALLLSLLFQRRYINLGSLYRYLGQKLGFSDEGVSRPKFDNYIEDIIGVTIDNYNDYKLLNDSGLVLESDLACFRIGKHPKVFSIFLTADKQERIKRVEIEGRTDAVNVLEQRDVMLRAVYQKLWDIDYFDTELIDRKYNQVLDNSNLSLDAELRMILEQLKQYNSFTNVPVNYWEEMDMKIKEYVDLFWEKGKDGIRSLLINNNLLVTPEEIMLDVTKTFPEDISQYPDNIRNLFLGINRE